MHEGVRRPIFKAVNKMFLIYLPIHSPRCQYVFDKIFAADWGIAYRVTDDREMFQDAPGPKLNYSPGRIADEFFIKATPLLTETAIRDVIAPVAEIHELKVLFPCGGSCDLGFDIFSAVFFLLSRYEEYLPFTPDRFGRYPPDASVAGRNHFLEIPLVDKWTDLLKTKLLERFPSLECRAAAFNVVVTYDIDVAYKYRGRSRTRNVRSILKDLLQLNAANLRSRYQTLYRQRQDPWDTYQVMKTTIESSRLAAVVFFLLGEYSRYNKNLEYQHPLMKRLVKEVITYSQIGIHPSFNSSVETGQILLEKQRLEQLSGQKITKSRQHFLKFTLPGTYRALLEAGITEDYSMGYPYARGFRAGTSKPFYFYDLQTDKATPLVIFPVCMMDGNFMDNRPVHRETILGKIYDLIDEVQSVKGTFIPIWHNHTISNTAEYHEWKNIHDQMIDRLVGVLQR